MFKNSETKTSFDGNFNRLPFILSLSLFRCESRDRPFLSFFLFYTLLFSLLYFPSFLSSRLKIHFQPHNKLECVWSCEECTWSGAARVREKEEEKEREIYRRSLTLPLSFFSQNYLISRGYFMASFWHSLFPEKRNIFLSLSLSLSYFSLFLSHILWLESVMKQYIFVEK